MFDKLYKDIITAGNDKLDALIRDAFRKHFGYDIDKADKSELKHYLTLMKIESYAYRGEIFLYVSEWDYDYNFSNPEKVTCTMKMSYKFV